MGTGCDAGWNCWADRSAAKPAAAQVTTRDRERLTARMANPFARGRTGPGA